MLSLFLARAVLGDINSGGARRKVLMLANRNGFLYTLDRTNGKLMVAKPFIQTTWAKLESSVIPLLAVMQGGESPLFQFFHSAYDRRYSGMFKFGVPLGDAEDRCYHFGSPL